MDENQPPTHKSDRRKETHVNGTSNLAPTTTSGDHGLVGVATNGSLSDTSACSCSTEDSGIGMGPEAHTGHQNGLSHPPPPPPLSSSTSLESRIEYTALQPRLPPLHSSPRHTQLPRLYTDGQGPVSCAVTVYPSATCNSHIFPRVRHTSATPSGSITTSSRISSYPTLSLLHPVTTTNSAFQPILPWIHQEQPSGNGHYSQHQQPHPATTHHKVTLVNPAPTPTTTSAIPTPIPVSIPPGSTEWPLKSVSKAQSSTLLYGMFTKDGTRWKCEECQRLFSSQGSLRAHARIHTGERPYQCQYCFRTFCQASTLRSHERLHTGEKPYKCEHCGRAFTQSAGLRSHLKTHRYDS